MVLPLTCAERYILERTSADGLPRLNISAHTSHVTNHIFTRMHSSRMLTGRSLTVCRSLLPGGRGICSRGCLLWEGGVCSQGGCLLWGCLLLGVSASGGVCYRRLSALGGGCLLLGGCLPPWGVCSGVFVFSGECLLPGGVCSWGGWGVSASGGGVVSQHVLRQTPPPCEQNDKQVQKYYLGHNFVAAGNKISEFYCPQTKFGTR